MMLDPFFIIGYGPNHPLGGSGRIVQQDD